MRTMAAGLFFIAMASTTASPLDAHEHATGIVKERMDAMAIMSKRTEAILARLKAGRELDAIKADAEAIASHAAHITHEFPDGSTQPPTRARKTIWQNWPDFESKAKALEDASRALAKVDPTDLPAMQRGVAAMEHACDGCHGKYRARR